MAGRREPISTRRIVLEAVFAGGAIFALFGTLISNGFGYFGGENDRISERQIEACKRAFETLGDENLNPNLKPEQTDALISAQLRLALKCTKEMG
jgi:hypothetical protein